MEGGSIVEIGGARYLKTSTTTSFTCKKIDELSRVITVNGIEQKIIMGNEQFGFSLWVRIPIAEGMAVERAAELANAEVRRVPDPYLRDTLLPVGMDKEKRTIKLFSGPNPIENLESAVAVTDRIEKNLIEAMLSEIEKTKNPQRA